MKVIGVIPARMAATRLPNKPLIDIGGKPMIQRVWERASEAACLNGLVVATPDLAIYEAVEAFGGAAVMTSDAHRSGTDRLAEVAAGQDADILVNIQGDEPLIEPETIERVVAPFLLDPALPMASVMCVCPLEERDNPATVKVVCNRRGDALYFSRARIPFQRNADSTEGAAQVMQHVGLYAYRRDFLLEFAALPPTPLEQTESLEQLRALENGYTIRLVTIDRAPLSVDTPDDLERVRAYFSGTNG